MTQKKDIWPSITMVKTMIPRVQLRKQDGEHGKRKRKHRIQIFLCRTRKRIGDYSARKSEKKRGKRLLRPIRVRHLFDFFFFFFFFHHLLLPVLLPCDSRWQTRAFHSSRVRLFGWQQKKKKRRCKPT